MRNAQSKVSKTVLIWLLPLLKDLWLENEESFELAWRHLCGVVEAKVGKAWNWLDDTYHEISVYLESPPGMERIKSTNPLERLIRAPAKGKASASFPTKRLHAPSGSYLQGYSEDWTSGRIYLSEPLEKIREIPKRPGRSSRRATGWSPAPSATPPPQDSSPSQQGRLFMKKNLTWIYKMKTCNWSLALHNVSNEESDALKQPRNNELNLHQHWDSTLLLGTERISTRISILLTSSNSTI
jgi:hypothetical protein